jgi:L-lysine 2,3-aminomutase
MTSDADNALKAKNLALSKSLRDKAHMLWLQEQQALDEVSKDRQLVKQEQAAEADFASQAATLVARMDKRLAAVDAEVCATLAPFCFRSRFIPQPVFG